MVNILDRKDRSVRYLCGGSIILVHMHESIIVLCIALPSTGKFYFYQLSHIEKGYPLRL